MTKNRRRGEVAILDADHIEIMATENGFIVRAHAETMTENVRVVTTLVELIELLTEWSYAQIGDFPVMNAQSPHAPVATRAALEFLARRHAGRPAAPGSVANAAPEIVQPPGNLSGVGRRVHPINDTKAE